MALKSAFTSSRYSLATPESSYESSGKAYRQALDTIPDHYPAVIDRDTFSRVQAVKASTVKTKGVAVVQNPLAGLGVCPLCASRMTRVTKGSGAKAVRPYLVCSKAKSGAGCEYRTVRLDNVEDAIRHSYDQLADPLQAYGSEGLAKDIQSLEASVLVGEDQIAELLDTLQEVGKSPAPTKRLRELETELEGIKREITAKRPLFGTRSLQARLGDLEESMGGTVAALNTALRGLFTSVVVDYSKGDLAMTAHSGTTVQINYQWLD